MDDMKQKIIIIILIGKKNKDSTLAFLLKGFVKTESLADFLKL